MVREVNLHPIDNVLQTAVYRLWCVDQIGRTGNALSSYANDTGVKALLSYTALAAALSS